MTEDTNCDVSLFVYPSLRDNSDINSLLFKADDEYLKIGEFYKVKITAADDFDLYASIL